MILPPSFSYFPSFFPTPQPPTQPPTQGQPNVFDRFPTTVTPGEQVMSKIEQVVEKEKTKEQETEITPSDPLLEYFKNADQILNDDFILQKEKDAADLENFIKQYQIDTLTDEIDQGRIPEILEFYFGGPDDSFFTRVLDLNPDEDTILFIQLIATNYGSQIMNESRLSIHIGTGDLYYDGVNTKESLYNFIASQKSTSKKRIREKLYYGGTFEQYLSKFLLAFDADADAKLDTRHFDKQKYQVFILQIQ